MHGMCNAAEHTHIENITKRTITGRRKGPSRLQSRQTKKRKHNGISKRERERHQKHECQVTVKQEKKDESKATKERTLNATQKGKKPLRVPCPSFGSE
mmetsp:Transcript_28197/g.55214  ORF Transcript_28197/g.55214 Transcript_28197/m.55214 type:complete len:98 (+) Transcript_28197:295-588(+)